MKTNKTCDNCGRERSFMHYQDCLIYQTQDLVMVTLDFCKKHEDVFNKLKEETDLFLQSKTLTWDTFIDHSALLSKGLDPPGLKLVRYGIDNAKDDIPDDEKQTFLDAVLYILYLYNQNSLKPMDHDITQGTDMNTCANNILRLEIAVVGDEGREYMKRVDYDGFLFNFGKHLFFRLYEQFALYSNAKNPRMFQWYCITIKLLSIYASHYRFR